MLVEIVCHLHRQVARQRLVERIVRANHRELVGEHREEQRACGGGGRADAPHAPGVESLRATGQKRQQHRRTLGRWYIADRQAPPFATLRLRHRTGACRRRDDEPATGGRRGREKRELGRAVSVLELVHTVEQKHEGFRGGGAEQVVLEGTLEFSGVIREFPGHPSGPLEFGGHTAGERGPVAGGGRSPAEVGDHGRVGMGSSVRPRPVSEQRALATARLSGDEQRPAGACGMCVERGEQIGAKHEPDGQFVSERLVDHALALGRVGNLVLREELVDGGREVGGHGSLELFRGGEALAHGKAARADAGLEVGKARAGNLALRCGVRTQRKRGVTVAEVEERAAGHGGVVQDPVHALQFGHRVRAVLGEPRAALDEFVADAFGHPAVAFAQDADEERSRGVDLGEADREHLSFGGLLVGNAPAKVHVREDHRALLAGAPQTREAEAREAVALGGEVTEGGGNEDADGARRGVRHRGSQS